MYRIATNVIKGNRIARIFGAIRLTNQRYEKKDKPLFIMRSTYFRDLESQTSPVNTKVIIQKGLNIFKKTYFKTI